MMNRFITMVAMLLWLVFGVSCTPSWFSQSGDSVVVAEDSGEESDATTDVDSDAETTDFEDNIGGSEGGLTVHMPFSEGYVSQCVQGTGGSYSHGYNSTRNDIDLDTPNDVGDPVFAPAMGTAFVHHDGENTGFGLHINLELSDGSFLLIGHLFETFVESGEEVAMGQLIGIEGTTGNSTGDHVHFGRHTGDARRSAGQSVSVAGLSMIARNTTTGSTAAHPLSQMTCGIPGGHRFQSRLETPLWHPNGSLIKSFDSPEVYLVQDGQKHHIANEGVFLGHRWDFDDVSLVTNEELDCYSRGEELNEEWVLELRYSNGALWLLDGPVEHEDARRFRVPMSEWEWIAESWGFDTQAGIAQYAERPEQAAMHIWPMAGYAKLRDGTLVKETGSSAVYIIVDGAATPIETWDAFLLLDYNLREIVEIPAGQLQAMQGAVGDCRTDLGCLTVENILTCGGAGFLAAEPEENVDPDSDTEQDTEPDTEPDTELHHSDWYLDADQDGYGRVGESVSSPTPPTSLHVLRTGDCNDLNAAVYPAAQELCDSQDNNCNDVIDEGLEFATYYGDIDGDGYGSTDYFLSACNQPPAYVPVAGDCNDLDSNSYPGAQESCDGIDNDCNGIVDDNDECVDPCSCD